MSRRLASAITTDGVEVAGTREALLIGELSIPWEQIQSAEWDKESACLVVAVVGHWGDERPMHRLALTEPGRLLQLVRERVTASVVLQRHVPIEGRRGVFVIGRRAPGGRGPIEWIFEFQEGIDPADPVVRRTAEAALRLARDDVGEA